MAELETKNEALQDLQLRRIIDIIKRECPKNRYDFENTKPVMNSVQVDPVYTNKKE